MLTLSVCQYIATDHIFTRKAGTLTLRQGSWSVTSRPVY